MLVIHLVSHSLSWLQGFLQLSISGFPGRKPFLCWALSSSNANGNSFLGSLNSLAVESLNSSGPQPHLFIARRLSEQEGALRFAGAKPPLTERHGSHIARGQRNLPHDPHSFHLFRMFLYLLLLLTAATTMILIAAPV